MAAGAPAFKRLLPTVVEQRGQEAFEIGIGARQSGRIAPDVADRDGRSIGFPISPDATSHCWANR
jgi:hypothetical protein